MTKPLEYTTFAANPEFYRLAFQRPLPALVGFKNRVSGVSPEPQA